MTSTIQWQGKTYTLETAPPAALDALKHAPVHVESHVGVTDDAYLDSIAACILTYFPVMSKTDQTAVQAAILRAQRKALKEQMVALKPVKEQQ